MSHFVTGLIGIDVKPRRKSSRSTRNRFRAQHRLWLFPVIVALVTLAIVVAVRTL